jgi:hypothetical protein
MLGPDSSTLNYNSDAAPVPTWGWVRSIEWVAGILSMLSLAVMLWGARLPLVDIVPTLLGGLMAVVAGGFWTVAAAAEVDIFLAANRPAHRKTMWLVLWTPTVLSVTWALLHAGVTSQLVFRANKPAMNAWAQSFLTTPAPPKISTPVRIGLYTAYDIEPIQGGVKFFVEGAGFFRSAGGFAYSPSGPPPVATDPSETFTPLGGAWYMRTVEEP